MLNIFLFAAMTFLLSPASVVKVLLGEAKSPEYDTLILGESHGECDFDPFLLSEKTGTNAINLSKASMPVTNLYYILAEANTHKQYKTVIIDMSITYWTIGREDGSGKDGNLLWRLTGRNRLDYIWNCSLKDNFNMIFGDYLLNTKTIKQIPQNVKVKLSKAYKEADESAVQAIYEVLRLSERFEYRGRGFRYGIGYFEEEWPSSQQFDKSAVRDENIHAFERIVEYCKENGIELICVQVALPPYRLKNEKLDDVHDFFADLCEKYDVTFYDMDYLKAGYLDRTDNDYVDLDGHMMGELAERHTAVLADILNAENTEDFFYKSYDEVLAHLEGGAQ